MAASLKIVVTGPESSGKSALVRELAEKHSLPYVKEYARLYLEREGPEYDFDLVSKLAREHWAFQHEQILQAKDRIILDTDLISFLIWQRVVFNKVDPWILDKIQAESDHVYLLCYPDIPWEDDPLRENPHNRIELFELYKKAFTDYNRPFEIVSGLGKARYALADKLFSLLSSNS